MIRRLNEDGYVASALDGAVTFEYRHLEVGIPNVGVLGALGKLFFGQKSAAVWEDQVQIASLENEVFTVGETSFRVQSQSVSGRHTPTMTIMAITEDTSYIPVYQRVDSFGEPAPTFFRCAPTARLRKAAGETTIEPLEGPALAIYRKSEPVRRGDLWVVGNLYVLAETPLAMQTELFTALTVIILS